MPLSDHVIDGGVMLLPLVEVRGVPMLLIAYIFFVALLVAMRASQCSSTTSAMGGSVCHVCHFEKSMNHRDSDLLPSNSLIGIAMFTKKESCEIASHQTLLDEFEGRGKNGGKKMSKEKLGIERELSLIHI